MAAFHLLRPWWLLGLFSIVLVIIQYRSRRKRNSSWQKICDAHLLSHLLQQQPHRVHYYSQFGIIAAIIIASFSLAGPTWSRLPQSLYTIKSPAVVVLDLSDTMLAHDLKPSRLSRAKFKLQDIVANLTQTQLGLVVFAAEPYTVSPLTQDTATILAMIPELENNIIPVQGSDIAAGLQQAATLMKQAGYSHGKILLMTANRPSVNDENTAVQLAKDGYPISVMAIGAAQLVSADKAGLQRLASQGGGKYFSFTNDNQDIQHIIAYLKKAPDRELKKTEIQSDQWQDNGRYWMLLLLPLTLLAFRRGWMENLR